MTLRPYLAATAIAAGLLGPAILTDTLRAEARTASHADHRGAGAGLRGLEFSDIDTDGDGVISEAEWDALRDGSSLAAARAARLIEAHDTDGDGLLSAEELAAALAEMRAGAGNRDGARDGARARAHGAPARMSVARAEAMRERMATRMFEAMDADGDGLLSAEEFADGLARMQARMAEAAPRARGDRDTRGHAPRERFQRQDRPRGPSPR